jgi:nicotinate-nucleotide--dimethylbenzimidazole phosphoribosyltransferase
MTDPNAFAFSPSDRAAVYRAILTRRDVRAQFRPDPVPQEVLLRVLNAAHHAPSVGFSQPWSFVVIDSTEQRLAVKALFERENSRAAENYSGERLELYRSLKLEGILDSPLNVCVACDRKRGGPHVLGRNTILDADLFSTCLAVENLWLAARTEGLGVGWVSILDPVELARLLELPDHVVPLAYLCLGYATEFLPEPELQTRGWGGRLPLADAIHANRWGRAPRPRLTPADIRHHLDRLTKPPGSLGRLEALALRLAGMQQTLAPRTRPRRLVLFAADHGVVAEGVTAWPAEVTHQMVQNIAAGGAASSVLARTTGTDLRLVDVGTLGPDLGNVPGYSCRKVRAGSRNLAREPALTVGEFERALAVGREQALLSAADGMQVVAAGEMGIGNSTPASCLTALLAEVPAETAVGRGAGADDDALARKRAVVAGAVAAQRERLGKEPVAAIAAVTGLELAALAGFFMAAAELGLTVVLDGYIATAAALAAERLRPGTAASMIAAHRSAEPGHAAALGRLGLEPFLDSWGMRLGEGTGALLLLPLLDSAAAILGEMATFESAGIES